MDTMDSLTKDFERIEIDEIIFRKGFDTGRGVDEQTSHRYLVLALFMKDNGHQSEHNDVLFGDEASVPVMARSLKRRYQDLKL